MDNHNSKNVRIVRQFPDDLQTHFISNMTIQHQADHFILSFFEIWPPAILADTDEERQEIIDKIETIEAKCVARIVLTPEKMKEVATVINENIVNFDKFFKE